MHRRAALTTLAAFAFAGASVAAEKVDKKKGGGDSFIQLPTIAVTVRRLGGGNGVMTIDVGVDVPDGGLRHRADQSTPLLRDAYLREMLTYAPTLGAGQPPNPDVIGAMLQRATDRTLGASRREASARRHTDQLSRAIGRRPYPQQTRFSGH